MVTTRRKLTRAQTQTKQGDLVDSIERNFDLAQHAVESATKETKLASQYASKARKVRCEQSFLLLLYKVSEIEHKSIFSFRLFFSAR